MSYSPASAAPNMSSTFFFISDFSFLDFFLDFFLAFVSVGLSMACCFVFW